MQIYFTTQIFKEGRLYVAHTPELDVSSCGSTKQKAQKNLLEAVRLFLEEAGKMGTLQPKLCAKWAQDNRVLAVEHSSIR